MIFISLCKIKNIIFRQMPALILEVVLETSYKYNVRVYLVFLMLFKGNFEE